MQKAGRLAHLEYRYLTEFQSHEPEFDYLKSLEIEEKINQVQWVPHHTDSQLILSTNDKTVKLWKVAPRNPPQHIPLNQHTDIPVIQM